MNFGETKKFVKDIIDRDGDTRVEVNLKNLINAVRTNLMASRPFNFMKVVPPSFTTQEQGTVTLPLSSYAEVERWYQPGWLILKDGVDTYIMKYRDAYSGAWHNIRVHSLISVKRYNFDGTPVTPPLIIVDAEYISRADVAAGTTGEAEPTYCCVYDLPGTYRYSYFRVSPIPDQNYLLSVSFVLKDREFSPLNSNADQDYVMYASPFLYVYGTLAEYFQIFEDEERAMYYRGLYEQKKKELIDTDNNLPMSQVGSMGYTTGAARSKSRRIYR